MSVQSEREGHRNAVRMAHRMANAPKRKRGRYQEGGLTAADEDVAKSLVPDRPERQASDDDMATADTAPPPSAAPKSRPRISARPRHAGRNLLSSMTRIPITFRRRRRTSSKGNSHHRRRRERNNR
jgi:hypothetical protein